MAFDEKTFLAELAVLSDEDIRKMRPKLREKRLKVADEVLRQRKQYRADNPPWYQTWWAKPTIIVLTTLIVGLSLAGIIHHLGWR